MFGMGGSEIIVILVVALIFLGPDKLPSAAKSISKGIRDIKKQSRALQTQIENDEQIGGAIRDLKSALRGDEIAPRPIKPRITPATDAAAAAPALAVGLPTDENSILGAAPASESAPVLEVSERSILADSALEVSERSILDSKIADTTMAPKLDPSLAKSASKLDTGAASKPPPLPRITLPATAGEPGDVDDPGGDDDLAALIKPAAGSIAKGS